jgi:hypothetical protein
VQEFLGHQDTATTAIYTEVTADRLRGAVNLLSKRTRAEKVLDTGSVPTPIAPADGDATT